MTQDNGGQKDNEQNDGDDSHGCGICCEVMVVCGIVVGCVV